MIMAGAVVGFLLGLTYGKGLGIHKDWLPLCALSGALMGIGIAWFLWIMVNGE